jgi:hypothetical protein
VPENREGGIIVVHMHGITQSPEISTMDSSRLSVTTAVFSVKSSSLISSKLEIVPPEVKTMLKEDPGESKEPARKNGTAMREGMEKKHGGAATLKRRKTAFQGDARQTDLSQRPGWHATGSVRRGRPRR